METTVSGWAVFGCLWAIVCILAYLLKISKQWVYAFRIRRGRMQMNEWLELVGKYVDSSYREDTRYTKSAVKTFLAETSVVYFKNVIKQHQEDSK